jgi:hypothetical protein
LCHFYFCCLRSLFAKKLRPKFEGLAIILQEEEVVVITKDPLVILQLLDKAIVSVVTLTKAQDTTRIQAMGKVDIIQLHKDQDIIQIQGQ